METFRCPTCLFVLTDPEESRCPSCHKRLRKRGRPIVLGDTTKFATHEPLHIDLVLAEREEEKRSRKTAVPVAVTTTIVSEPEPVGHTTIFEPSQFDPEMRQVLDDLYRKARAEIDEDKNGERT